MQWHLDVGTPIQHLGDLIGWNFFGTRYPYLICMKFRHLHRGVRCVQILSLTVAQLFYIDPVVNYRWEKLSGN